MTPDEERKWARTEELCCCSTCSSLQFWPVNLVKTQNPHHFNAIHCFNQGEKENIQIFGLRLLKIQFLHDSLRNWEMCDKPSNPLCHSRARGIKSPCWTWAFDYSTKSGLIQKCTTVHFPTQHHSLSFRMWHQWVLHWALPINLSLYEACHWFTGIQSMLEWHRWQETGCWRAGL